MTRYEEIRAQTKLVTACHPDLANALDRVRQEADAQLSLMKAMAGAIGPVDLILGSLVGRSLDIVDGFGHAFERWNFTVASVLVRLQVDNVMIAHVTATTSDVDGLLKHILADQRLTNLHVPTSMAQALPEKDRRKAAFTDSTMRRLAGIEHPWIDDIYRLTSSWVHFSAVHYQNVWRIDENGRIFGRWPLDIGQFGKDFLLPMLNAMFTATQSLTNYLREWTSKKGLGG
ncbi:MAG: hypothetical protein WDA71_09860 [Actinomycetota bacterium]